MSDAVEILGLRVLGHHGALPGEQERAQPFAIDLRFAYDMEPAGRSDDLADAVDYGAVARVAAAVVEQRRFALLEALAQAVAEAVLADRRVREVEVRVAKLHPPVPFDVGSVAVVRRVAAAG